MLMTYLGQLRNNPELLAGLSNTEEEEWGKSSRMEIPWLMP